VIGRGSKGSTALGLLLVVIVIGVGAALAASALSGGDDDGTTSTTPSPPGSEAEVASDPTDRAAAAACVADRLTIETAEDTYFLLNSVYADMPTLVAEDFLVDASAYHEVVLSEGGQRYELVPRPACA
jgi:hypothetical protein